MAREDLFSEDFKPRPYWWDAAEPIAAGETALPEKIDVCIIGGGYTGLSCALELTKNGVKCAVIDAERIGEGASSRSGGLVTGGIKLAMSNLTWKLGEERKHRLAAEAIGTLNFLDDLISREGIDCDFARVGRLTCAYSQKGYAQMASLTDRLAELTGEPVYMLPRERQREEIGSDFYCGGQVVEASATLHPGKYVRGLAGAADRGGAILICNTRVTRLQKGAGHWTVGTDRGTIRADSVVLGTNGYTGKEMPWFRRRVVPVASFIIATEELPAGLARELLPNRRGIADSQRVLSYFRLSPDGKRVLWGGRVGTSAMDPRESGRRLHERMCQVWPQLEDVRITHSWNGNVAFTFDLLPHLGTHNGIHYALGCQGNGVAMQSWLGNQVARRIVNGVSDSAFADLPFPTAPLYGGNPWFLPGVLLWYRLRDRVDRMSA